MKVISLDNVLIMFILNSQDLLFLGALGKCPLCDCNLEFDGTRYSCKGSYSEWSSCTFKTSNPPRKEEPIKLPDSVLNTPIADVINFSSFSIMISFFCFVCR